MLESVGSIHWTNLPKALARLSGSHHAVVLVTNQSAVGRGLISLQEAQEINRRVVAEIRAHGGRMDAVYMCPHHPDEGCPCRKPAPSMLLNSSPSLLPLEGFFVQNTVVLRIDGPGNPEYTDSSEQVRGQSLGQG